MFKDASCAPPLQAHAGFDGFGLPEALTLPGPRPAGLGWRHLATAALLLLVLPVFAVAALACLPVALLVGGGEGLRKALAHVPAGRRR
jgi:hypothetical protein